ncbi:hypothetical protein Sfum_2812 [Syntrophobacter fumaroxidans MPOB]|uniref:Uncharacterized protein n=1 Tax=Syntrophobacter fumaroxidans (strain DSM 10017 / MPOB) TaxID=335543 RepID=A0LM38_SYNFM|nr:hypothetical protein Sfum_2812 [Syntrophobacter fumaroxidans MPOB]
MAGKGYLRKTPNRDTLAMPGRNDIPEYKSILKATASKGPAPSPRRFPASDRRPGPLPRGKARPSHRCKPDTGQPSGSWFSIPAKIYLGPAHVQLLL